VDRAWTPETLRALQRVTDVALAHLSLDELLSELLGRMTEILHTDTAAFLLLDEDADELVATAARGIEEEVEQGVRIPVGRGFAGRIAADRRAVVIEDVDHADILNPILRERGIRSLLGVPLLVESDVLGVLHVGTLTPRNFTSEDAELLQLAADRAAMAISHAHLYERERRALQTLQALQRVTEVGLSYLPLDQLLKELLERMTEILNADTAAFLLLDEDGDELVATAAKGIEEEVEQGVRIPVGRGFAGRIAAARHAVRIEDVDHADILNPILRERGIRSLLGVPLLVENEVIGVLHVGALTPRIFTDEDAELLQHAADRAATSIERARAFHQRGVVEALQHSLVPERLPIVPGLSLEARYRPAVRRGGIGGDWYDAFVLPRGGVALVAGDVMGHGIGAAAMMAQMRTGLRAYALDGHSPAGVTERLNRLALTLASHQMTTLILAVLDLESERMTVVSAGHLPPVLRRSDGSATVLDVESDVPLGVSSLSKYREHEFDLPVGGTVVLVTDGAVEVRGESLELGLERLCALVAGASNLDDMCEAVARGDARGRPADDDVAVLAACVEPLSESLRTRWPASAETLAAMRPLLRRWLARWGAAQDEIYDITVAVQEASANAVEHAYAPGTAVFEVEAEHADGVITFVVRDRGNWRAPRGTHRGRGLAMMRALMEEVDVTHDDRGTVVVLRRTLGRRAA
jgi:serine phosphatase RsbU (regulator of sigma subunit)/putative methionine-R-sulfoxide reductase with GAF domain/anti-sigma regulatory factor (Ser/Thr protein kinase)